MEKALKKQQEESYVDMDKAAEEREAGDNPHLDPDPNLTLVLTPSNPNPNPNPHPKPDPISTGSQSPLAEPDHDALQAVHSFFWLYTDLLAPHMPLRRVAELTVADGLVHFSSQS